MIGCHLLTDKPLVRQKVWMEVAKAPVLECLSAVPEVPTAALFFLVVPLACRRAQQIQNYLSTFSFRRASDGHGGRKYRAVLHQ